MSGSRAKKLRKQALKEANTVDVKKYYRRLKKQHRRGN